MNLAPLDSMNPADKGAVAQIIARTGSVVLAAAFLVRFSFLSVLACLLFTAPISLREVPYASHRPTSGH